MSKLGFIATSSAINKLERKISGKGIVWAGKGFAFLISNEGIDDIIKIVETLDKSGILSDAATEIVKQEIKKQEGEFLGAMMAHMAVSLIAPTVSSLIQPAASLSINAITRRGQ